MVSNISSSRYMLIPSLFHAQRTGKTQVPVRPSLSVYANFEHVLGVPSRPGQSNVPIGKLRTLDRLIDRLTGLRRVGNDFQPVYQTMGSTEMRQPHSISKETGFSKPLYPALSANTVEPGTLVNVLA